MSQLLDAEVLGHQALVVDANPTSRSVMMQNLRDFGFAVVKQASRATDARELLEHRRYDLVVCEDSFHNSVESGHELLEELRREQMLPYATVFVMVTGEATYGKVAEAAESALDSYLIKPFSANTLFERVKEARQRKRVLKDIFAAMEANKIEHAAALCMQRFLQRELYWLYAARIGAELLLNLQRPAEAKVLYDAIVVAKTVPWARLGVARAQLAQGEVSQARRALEELIADAPQFADSYDLMGKVLMEQGNLDEALETYRTAATLTPGCILRLQHCGTLSFYAGETRTATTMLERTWTLGSKSRLFDVLSMMLLAMLHFDAGDSKALGLAHDVLLRFSRHHPQSVRLRRMAGLGGALWSIQSGQPKAGLAHLRAVLEDINRPDFDMEAATNLLSVWSRVLAQGVPTAEYETVVRRIARRFSVSKATTEVLVAAARPQAQAATWIREVHAEVLLLAEQAMEQAVQGQPKAAVEALLRHGQDTGNAKLIEMAGLVARRHQQRIEGVDLLIHTAGTLSHRFCAPATHIAGIRRSNRSAGGMVLRR